MNETTDQVLIRTQKLQALRKLGVNPYPYGFSSTHTITQLIKGGDELVEKETEVSASGRLMAVRGKGKAVFANLQAQHQRLQIYVRFDEVGEKEFKMK